MVVLTFSLDLSALVKGQERGKKGVVVLEISHGGGQKERGVLALEPRHRFISLAFNYGICRII